MKPGQLPKQFSVAVVGATGAVGRAVLSILEQRGFPIHTLRLFASPKSAGHRIVFNSKNHVVEALTSETDFSGLDYIFFTAGSAVSQTHVPRAAAAGGLVIDNASIFRMRDDVPLVIPEVNAEALELARKNRIVANPNCTTAQHVVALKPLHDAFSLKRVAVSSYQAVSGRGQQGVEEFKRQIAQFASGKQPTAQTFPHVIAFNCLPHIDSFRESGFTGEEVKVMQETRKILGLPNLRIHATCVRVPVVNGHSESIAIETEKEISIADARAVLEKMPGLSLVDDPSKNIYPLATNATGRDEVLVGRLRLDPSLASNPLDENPKHSHGLLLWVVGDNLRKGAALNAVQIAEAAAQRGI